MWNYDKLFAVKNVIGVLNHCENKFEVGVVDDDNHYEWRDYYANNELSYKDETLKIDAKIQYIIRLDEHGNVVEKLFDRETDMPKPMPKLETGMFVRVYSAYKGEGILALIYDNRVIYQDGEWDEIYDLTEDIVMEVYSDKALCFNNCQNPYLIWQNPLSNKTN